jgi:cyanophycinase
MHCHIHRGVFIALLAAYFAAAAPVASSASAPHDYRDKNFDYFVVGDPSLPRAAHTGFTLALMGGGGIVDAAYAAIAAHAGGGHIVILRAVADDSFDPEDGDLGKSFAGKWGPVVSAETFVFHNREASFDPRIIAALRGADGIFLAGGDQGNYIRYWKGTPVQASLNAHVLANRPIGGSSAGLAILGHYSYTCLDGVSMESKVALADPYNSGVTIEDNFLHLRWLESVIIDTHFSKRSRLGRLIVFIARIGADRPHEHVFGIGIDEKTALLVGADGVGRVAAGSAGSAWVVVPRRRAGTLVKGEPLTMHDIRITRLDEGGSIDLRTRRLNHPGAETTDAIVSGTPSEDPLTSPMMLRTVVPPDEG